MTSGHFIFIPAILMIGMFLGFMLGTRGAQDQINLERKRVKDREEARKRRAERKAKRAAEKDAADDNAGDSAEESSTSKEAAGDDAA